MDTLYIGDLNCIAVKTKKSMYLPSLEKVFNIIHNETSVDFLSLVENEQLLVLNHLLKAVLLLDDLDVSDLEYDIVESDVLRETEVHNYLLTRQLYRKGFENKAIIIYYPLEESLEERIVTIDVNE